MSFTGWKIHRRECERWWKSASHTGRIVEESLTRYRRPTNGARTLKRKLNERRTTNDGRAADNLSASSRGRAARLACAPSAARSRATQLAPAVARATGSRRDGGYTYHLGAGALREPARHPSARSGAGQRCPGASRGAEARRGAHRVSNGFSAVPREGFLRG